MIGPQPRRSLDSMLCRIKACSDPISVRVHAASNWCDRTSTTQNGSVKHFMAVNLVVRTSIEAYRGSSATALMRDVIKQRELLLDMCDLPNVLAASDTIWFKKSWT